MRTDRTEREQSSATQRIKIERDVRQNKEKIYYKKNEKQLNFIQGKNILNKYTYIDRLDIFNPF